MIDFFTKLFTPIFIGLGLVSAPIEIPPEPQIQIEQQEIQQLQERIKELEDQQENEILEEDLVAKEVNVVEKKKVINQPKEIKVQEKVAIEAPKTEEVVPITEESINTTPIVDTAYLEKVLRFQDKVEGMQEDLLEDIEKLNGKYDNLESLENEMDEMNKTFKEYELSLQLGYVDIDCTGGTTTFSCENKRQNELDKRRTWIINYSSGFEKLSNEYEALYTKYEKEVNNKKERLHKEIKELQDQWNIKSEDYIS